MSGRLLIMSCSQAKVATLRDRLPARDLYDGPGWRCYRAWRRRKPVGAALLPVLVLSAEHGLIEARELVEPYDRRLDAARADELAACERSRALLAEALAGDPELFLFGGRAYAELLGRLMPGTYVWLASCDQRSRGIGDQLRALREWLDGRIW